MEDSGSFVYATGYWTRFKLVVGSCFCLYQRVKGYQYKDTYAPFKRKKTLLYTGWYDWRKKINYITWVRDGSRD